MLNIKSVIHHPGKLTAEAAASGRSKMQQAEHDAQSSNPSTRGRGILGERLMGGDLHRDNLKAKKPKSSGLAKMKDADGDYD